MRDEFSQSVKSEVAHRAGVRCSNPTCGRPTSGPSDSDRAVTNVGVAAHMSAASPGGPRYDPAMTSEQRSSAANALWLCQVHAKAIDDDGVRYPMSLLLEWKRIAEERAREAIETGPHPSEPQVVNAAAYLATNAISISGQVILGPNAIHLSGPVLAEPPATLSPEAQRLLREVSLDDAGAVIVVGTFDGLSVSVNGQELGGHRNPRADARWRAVIQDLVRQGLLEQTDNKGQVFSLTDAGYRVAEGLPGDRGVVSD